MVSLQISDAVAAALNTHAAAMGLSVEAYLESVVLPNASHERPRISTAELDRLLDEAATGDYSPTGTFPRSEIYSDHD